MTRKAAKTGPGAMVLVAIEQYYPEGERILNDDLAHRILPVGFRVELWSDPNGDGDPSDGALVAADANGDGDYTDALDTAPPPGSDANFNRLPDGGRALVVGHSPTNEAAVLDLTGTIVAPLAKGAGVLVVADDDGYRVEPLA